MMNVKLRLMYFKRFEQGMSIKDIEELVHMPEDDFKLKIRSGLIEPEEAILIKHDNGSLLRQYYDEWVTINNRNKEREEIERSIYSLLEQGYTQKRIMIEKGYPRKTVQAFTKVWVSEGNVEPKEEVVTVKKQVKENKVTPKKEKKLSKKKLELIRQKEEKEALELKKKQEEEENARIQEKLERFRQQKEEEDKRVVKTKTHSVSESHNVNKNGIPNDKKAYIKEYKDVAVTDDEVEVPKFKLNMPKSGTINIPELNGININVDIETNENYEENAIHKETDKYRRGDIVFVSNEAYDEKNGIVGKSRPALIIQNNDGNYYSGNVIVCYITSVLKRYTLPTHVYVEDTECLRKSMVLTEQIQTVKKGYISYMGRINEKEMLKVEYAIIHSLGLENFVEKLVEDECRRRGKLQLDMVGYEMLKNEDGEDFTISSNPFKTLEVSELASENFVYDLKGGIKVRRREDGEDVIQALSYGLSLKEINSLIDELQQIKNYLMLK